MFIAGVLLALFFPLTDNWAGPDEGKKFPAPFSVKIPMRDGKKLAVDVFLPKGEGKFPTILIMTPYNRKLLGAAIPAASAVSKLIDREHYVFVVVDWRGFFGSKDAGGDVGKVQADLRGKDGYDTVEWIAKQKWSNSKVGMWGVSALGKIQYWTAIQQPPHLVCICPAVAQHGYFYEHYYHGGVYKKNYSGIHEQVGYTGAEKKILAHPTYDNLWKLLESPIVNKYSRINLPILIIGGWYDTYTEGVLQTFNALRKLAGSEARKSTKMIIGPWIHVDAASGKLKQGELKFSEAARVSEKEAKRFFDYYLRDKKDNGYDKEPAIRYFQMGENKWKNSSAWPPANLKEVSYFLQAEGKLLTDKPDEDCQPDTFRYDPNDPSPTVGGMTICKFWDPAAPKIAAGPMDQRVRVEGRKDHVSYSTDVLDKDVAVRDVVKVKLYVSSDRVDTDFAIRLCDVYPDGRSMLITDGIHRMRFRESLQKEKLMKPGEVYEVTVVLTPTAHTFRKKHRIRILVSSSNYPRFDRNPNNGEHFFTDKKKALVATNKIYHDSSHLSALFLPAGAK